MEFIKNECLFGDVNEARLLYYSALENIKYNQKELWADFLIFEEHNGNDISYQLAENMIKEKKKTENNKSIKEYYEIKKKQINKEKMKAKMKAKKAIKSKILLKIFLQNLITL